MTSKISKNTPSSLKNYAKELKSGYHFSIDASYYLKETFGFGVKFSIFSSQNELDNIILEDTLGNIQSGKISDKITIIYIGPNLNTTC